MNYAYIRFSTDKQDERQQMNAIENYLRLKGLSIDRYEMDEGVSGGVSYKNRKLNDLVKSMSQGDSLIVTEISRLGRSMSDINKLVADELKPRGVRLIVIAMGLDLDCANIKALDEMIIFAFSFAAQLEKELIITRTRSALEARKKSGMEIGGTNSLWGRKTGSDRKEAIAKASRASAESRRLTASINPANKEFLEFMEYYIAKHGAIGRNYDWESVSAELNRRGKRTATGMEFTGKRARSMYDKLKTQING